MKRVPLLLLIVLLMTSCAALPTLRPTAAATAAASPAETAFPSPTPAATLPPAPSPTPSPSPLPTPSPTDFAAPSQSPAATPTAQAATASPSITATRQHKPSGKPAAVSLALPPALYGVVGREMALWLDNVALASGPYDCGTSGPGKLEGRRWSWTPDKEGDYTLTVQAGGQRMSTVVHVAPAQAGEGVLRRCLFLGDSITERGGYTGRLLQIAGADGLKLTLLGSRGKAPNRTEGRSGWKTLLYTSYQKYNGVPNPFYHPKTKRFDFKYYMKTMKYGSVDRVCIALGTNDVFAFKSDAALKQEINRILRRLDTMVRSIRAYDRKIVIGIFLTTPPTNQPNTFLKDYGKKQTLTRYERNRFLYVNALMEKYKGREKDGIYLVPVNANFDAQYCYGVHPYGVGYDQMAETVWCWLKNLEE